MKYLIVLSLALGLSAPAAAANLSKFDINGAKPGDNLARVKQLIPGMNFVHSRNREIVTGVEGQMHRSGPGKDSRTHIFRFTGEEILSRAWMKREIRQISREDCRKIMHSFEGKYGSAPHRSERTEGGSEYFTRTWGEKLKHYFNIDLTCRHRAGKTSAVLIVEFEDREISREFREALAEALSERNRTDIAGTAVSAERFADIRNFDIRGVKLGDELRDVQARFPNITMGRYVYKHRKGKEVDQVTGVLYERLLGVVKNPKDRTDSLKINFTGEGSVYEITVSQALWQADCREVGDLIEEKYGAPTERYSDATLYRGRWYPSASDQIASSKGFNVTVSCQGEPGQFSMNLKDEQIQRRHEKQLRRKVADALSQIDQTTEKTQPNF